VEIGSRGLTEAAEETRREGRVVTVYPEIQGGRVIADVAVEGLGDYFVGERTLAWVSAGVRRAIVVPAAFVFRRAGVNYVKSVDGAEIVVQPGERHGDSIEILAGLADGDALLAP